MNMAKILPGVVLCCFGLMQADDWGGGLGMVCLGDVTDVRFSAEIWRGRKKYLTI